MSWTCPGHYKVHVYGRDSPGYSVHGHCPVPLPVLLTHIHNNFQIHLGLVVQIMLIKSSLAKN